MRFLLAFVPWNDAAFFGFLFFFLFGVVAPSVVDAAAAAFIPDITAPSDADLATDVFFLRFLTTLQSAPAAAAAAKEDTLFWPPPAAACRRGEDDLDVGAEAL